MKCTAKPIITAMLTFINEETNESNDVVIKEGQLLKGLTYLEGTVEKKIDGVLKAINFTSKAFTSGKDGCIHDDEPAFDKYITINSITVDYSGQYDCQVVQIPVSRIVSIEMTEDLV